MEPFAIIEDFFSALSLMHYRKYVRSVLQSANSARVWKKEDPGSLLYFQQKMEDLLDAAHQLIPKRKNSKSGKPLPGLKPELFGKDLIDPASYSYPGRGRQWQDFPRALSKKEFLNPYLVFDRFFRHHNLKGWHDELKELIFYALSPHNCAEDFLDFELLKVHHLLQKLIEAAHLVLIREIRPHVPEA
jgi:hypothetical protein